MQTNSLHHIFRQINLLANLLWEPISKNNVRAKERKVFLYDRVTGDMAVGQFDHEKNCYISGHAGRWHYFYPTHWADLPNSSCDLNKFPVGPESKQEDSNMILYDSVSKEIAIGRFDHEKNCYISGHAGSWYYFYPTHWVKLPNPPKRYSYWYSEKQKSILVSNVCKALRISKTGEYKKRYFNGDKEYTEARAYGSKPAGGFDDYYFVGHDD